MILKIFKIFILVLMIPNFVFANNQFFQEGLNLYQDKKFNEAKFKFEQDIVFNPKNEMSYLYLSEIFKNLDKKNLQEQNLKVVILLNPKNEEAIYNLEKKIGINLTSNQKIIEFSPLAFKFLNILSKKINSYEGGLLIIDYGYFEKKMRNSLQSVYKHSFNNIFNNLGEADISYSLNFFLIKKIAKKLNLNVAGLTDQRSFLTNLGILHRAEIMSNNLKFTKKADIYYRLKRLIDKDLMGGLFKVMFLTKKNIKFKMGF